MKGRAIALGAVRGDLHLPLAGLLPVLPLRNTEH